MQTINFEDVLLPQLHYYLLQSEDGERYVTPPNLPGLIVFHTRKEANVVRKRYDAGLKVVRIKHDELMSLASCVYEGQISLIAGKGDNCECTCYRIPGVYL